MSKVHFKSDNIVAILSAARRGGTHADIIKRSGTGISESTLSVWLKKGRADTKAGKESGWSLFAKTWEDVYPGNRNNEEKVLAEMKSALKQLETKQPNDPKPNQGSGRRSRRQCECGNEKEPGAIACNTCMELDAPARSMSQ